MLVAVAGFDAIALPALGYGVYESRWRAPLARYVLTHATRVLPCSATLIEHENRYSAWPDPLRNGVRAHVPGFDTPVTVVPFGFDAADWPPGPAERGGRRLHGRPGRRRGRPAAGRGSTC